MEVVTSLFHIVAGSHSQIRWDEHSLMKSIGSGSSGPVYLAKDKSGMPLAIKKADIKELDQVKLLSKLSHKNIVKYLGVETKEETSYILLEYVPGGSVSSHLLKRPFTEDEIRTYTQQLLWGLQYLHQNKIKHGDIKGANILFDSDGCIKLADFGRSKQGAQLWMAPEVLNKDLHNSRFTDKSDIWSVGCTVIEMATGKDPWRGKYHPGASFLKHMEKLDSVPPIPDNLSSNLEIFLRQCLKREHDSRPSASKLLQDPFITRQKNTHPFQATPGNGRDSVYNPPTRTGSVPPNHPFGIRSARSQSPAGIGSTRTRSPAGTGGARYLSPAGIGSARSRSPASTGGSRARSPTSIGGARFGSARSQSPVGIGSARARSPARFGGARSQSPAGIGGARARPSVGSGGGLHPHLHAVTGASLHSHPATARGSGVRR